MSVKVIEQYEFFKDLDGNQLENGYIYIGESGSSPETTPVSVYTDSGLTVPLSQPLRTSGGYIVNNGSPVNVYVGEIDYSINVRDVGEALVYAKLSGNVDLSTARASQLPELVAGDVGRIIKVNATYDGYETEDIKDIAMDKTTTQTIAGTKTFTGQAKGITPVDTDDFTTKAYVDSIVPATASSGTYTPVISNLFNVASSTIYDASYVRISNIVTVSGVVSIAATTASGTSFYLSLPTGAIAATGEVAYGVYAHASTTSGNEIVGRVLNSTGTTDKVAFQHISPSTVAIKYAYTYTYQVI